MLVLRTEGLGADAAVVVTGDRSRYFYEAIFFLQIYLSQCLDCCVRNFCDSNLIAAICDAVHRSHFSEKASPLSFGDCQNITNRSRCSTVHRRCRCAASSRRQLRREGRPWRAGGERASQRCWGFARLEPPAPSRRGDSRSLRLFPPRCWLGDQPMWRRAVMILPRRTSRCRRVCHTRCRSGRRPGGSNL